MTTSPVMRRRVGKLGKLGKIVALGDDIHVASYYSDLIKDLGFSLFVYSYKDEGYEGSGFAVWKVGRKWYYSSLGHCSCDGPFDYIEQAKNAGFTFDEVKKVANEVNYNTHASAVIAYIEKNNK